MGDIDFTKIKCDHEGCTVSIDGKCIEGFELSQCTFHHPIEDEHESHPIEEPVVMEILESVHSGDALNIEECHSITSSSFTNVIILAGSAESGKTTLIASIFDLFQRECSLNGYMFAGSRSLIGLEKRCHESRIASNRKSPKTERTKFTPDDPKFIHFKLKNIDKNTLKDLLFTDISGEHFRQLSNSTEECEKFVLIKRADHFVLFFDSDLLSDISTRHQTKTNGLGILRSLIEAKMLINKTLIEIVFSKWDLLLTKEEVKQNTDYIDEIKKEISSKYPSTQWQIRFFEIASRPHEKSDLKFGHGIDKLLPIWAEESILFLPDQENKHTPTFDISPTREFSKYKFI